MLTASLWFPGATLTRGPEYSYISSINKNITNSDINLLSCLSPQQLIVLWSVCNLYFLLHFMKAVCWHAAYSATY